MKNRSEFIKEWFFDVLLAGFEPAILAEQRPKRCAYADSATGANQGCSAWLILSHNRKKKQPSSFWELGGLTSLIRP
jgi:hypothetical protein